MLILMICVYLKKGNRKIKESHHSRNLDSRVRLHNIYEVEAPGDDFVDFGAVNGPYGQFSWHADFPLE